MADANKEGVAKGSDPEVKGPQKGHTSSPQAEVQEQGEEVSTIEAEVEVTGVQGGQVFVKFGEGDEQREGTIPVNEFEGDPSPGKRTVKMSNAAYTQMVINADPSVMNPVQYRFADSDEVLETPARDEQEESERRQADRERELEEGEEEVQADQKSGDQGKQKPPSRAEPKTL